MIIKKTCKHHGILNQKDIVKAGIAYGKQRYKCRICLKFLHKKHYENNKDVVLKKTKEYKKNHPNWEEIKKISDAKYRINNKDSLNQAHARYRMKNLDKRRAVEKDRKKVYRETLADPYIKDQIAYGSNLKHSDIPQALVEFKRVVYMLKRKIRENKSEKHMLDIKVKLKKG